MKKLLLLIALVFFSTNLYSQLDRSINSTSIKGLGVPARSLNSPLLPAVKNDVLSDKGLFFNPPENPDPFKKEEEPISMSTDNGLMDYEVEFEPNYLKDKGAPEEFKNDMHLGKYTTAGTFVDIICRDHEYVDGDKVQVLLNGEVVEHSVSLVGSYRGIIIKLKNGYNRIDIVALNQGSSGPNTAEFKIYDDKGKLLSQNVWNLATGYKGTIVVMKE